MKTKDERQKTKDGAKIIICSLPVCNEKSQKRRCEFIGSRLALEKILDFEPIIEHNEDGKPFIKNSTINISIAHTAEKVAVIAHPTSEVGIDIEKISEKINRLAPRFLSEEEFHFFENKENKTLYFTLAWCAKEAAYKIIGKAAVDFRQSLMVLPFETTENEGEFEICHLKEKNYLCRYKILENFIMVYIVK